MSELPCGLLEMLVRYFGTETLPTYGKTLGVFVRDPYRTLRDRIARLAPIHDLTDGHCDLGWSWWFQGESGKTVNLRLSFVGPYAVLVDDQGNVNETDRILEVVRSEGFIVCTLADLSAEVKIWEPEVGGCVYEFLFEFDNGTPWDR
jgi:hypothetical protein